MAFIAPKFRRESWYGRLYRHAYGVDRGWLVRLKRMTFSTGFEYAPYPTLSAEMSEAEQLTTLLNWRCGREEAYERALAFLAAPPPVQPFVESGPRVSICPTFWKIVFALFVYCPIVAIRAAGRMIRDGVRVTLTAIASAFRWVGHRYGRPIAWGTTGVLALATYAVFLQGIVWLSYNITGDLMPRQGMSRDEYAAQEHAALLRSLEADTAARRERLRHGSLERCVAAMRPPVGQYVLDPWALEERQSDFRMTTQRELERCALELDYSHTSYGSYAHEEVARKCPPATELLTAMIDRVARGDLDCATDGWSFYEPEGLFRTADDQKALATWLTGKLRERFAVELAAEMEAREKRIAEARREDAKIVGAITAELLPVRQDPRQLYERFQQSCWYDEDNKRWEARSHSLSDATCTTLAGLFGTQIDTARSDIRWQRFKDSARANAPFAAMSVGWTIGGFLLLVLLISVFGRYGQPLLRGLEWFFEHVLGPGLKWLAIIVFAPVWVPAWYLIWPALKVMGRAVLLVWNFGPVSFVRHVFVSVLIGIVYGIWRFFVALGQIIADTWHLIRAFASASWHQLCPFIEWN